jgi:hypothetical protein
MSTNLKTAQGNAAIVAGTHITVAGAAISSLPVDLTGWLDQLAGTFPAPGTDQAAESVRTAADRALTTMPLPDDGDDDFFEVPGYDPADYIEEDRAAGDRYEAHMYGDRY